MNQRAETILKAFLSRLPDTKRKALERFLPENERAWLEELPEFIEGGVPEEAKYGDLLEKVHWSWFLPTLKSFSTKEQNLFLAALSPLPAENLRQALLLKSTPEHITEIARQFIREQLLQSITTPEEQYLPTEYLPAFPLNVLLQFNKKQLTRLIDLLPLYDLTAELSQIVETKILKKIYSFLTDEQKAVMKHLGTQKEIHPLPRLGLERWDGEEETLRNLLHKRGLVRLGIALSGASPNLIWMLCHQLDIGRGNTLFKLCAPEAKSPVSEAIMRQIEELLRYL